MNTPNTAPKTKKIDTAKVRHRKLALPVRIEEGTLYMKQAGGEGTMPLTNGHEVAYSIASTCGLGGVSLILHISIPGMEDYPHRTYVLDGRELMKILLPLACTEMKVEVKQS